MLDHTAGTLTASSAVLTDANSKVDALKTANLTIGANSITSASGDVDIVANANLDIDAATVDLSTQATEFKIKDAESTAFTIAEGSNNYVTLKTIRESLSKEFFPGNDFIWRTTKDNSYFKSTFNFCTVLRTLSAWHFLMPSI